MADYRRGAHTLYEIKYHFVWVTKYRYQVPLPRAARRGGRTRSGPDPADLPRARRSNRQRPCKPGSRAHSGLVSTDLESGRHYEARKGSLVSEIAAGVFAFKEAVLGTALLGAGLFLCVGWAGNRGADSRLHRTS